MQGRGAGWTVISKKVNQTDPMCMSYKGRWNDQTRHPRSWKRRCLVKCIAPFTLGEKPSLTGLISCGASPETCAARALSVGEREYIGKRGWETRLLSDSWGVWEASFRSSQKGKQWRSWERKGKRWASLVLIWLRGPLVMEEFMGTWLSMVTPRSLPHCFPQKEEKKNTSHFLLQWEQIRNFKFFLLWSYP